MKKHVNSCHFHGLKKWNVMVEANKSLDGVHPTRKRKTHPTLSSITSFFNYKNGPIQWAIIGKLNTLCSRGSPPSINN
jgi:hypothetical protein